MAREAVEAIRSSALGLDLFIQRISLQSMRMYIYYLMGYYRGVEEVDWGRMERKLGAMLLAHMEMLNMMAGDKAIALERRPFGGGLCSACFV